MVKIEIHLFVIQMKLARSCHYPCLCFWLSVLKFSVSGIQITKNLLLPYRYPRWKLMLRKAPKQTDCPQLSAKYLGLHCTWIMDESVWSIFHIYDCKKRQKYVGGSKRVNCYLPTRTCHQHMSWFILFISTSTIIIINCVWLKL